MALGWPVHLGRGSAAQLAPSQVVPDGFAHSAHVCAGWARTYHGYGQGLPSRPPAHVFLLWPADPVL